uniref:Uncharacterized protein n=1 Tax=Timema monikensis TaxID=170555 RepID=A0A7R9HUQ5_9NEOP|nr:unnamed protein product [Timema monikensis]
MSTDIFLPSFDYDTDEEDLGGEGLIVPVEHSYGTQYEELTKKHLKEIHYELGLIKLCWPELPTKGLHRIIDESKKYMLGKIQIAGPETNQLERQHSMKTWGGEPYKTSPDDDKLAAQGLTILKRAAKPRLSSSADSLVEAERVSRSKMYEEELTQMREAHKKNTEKEDWLCAACAKREETFLELQEQLQLIRLEQEQVIMEHERNIAEQAKLAMRAAQLGVERKELDIKKSQVGLPRVYYTLGTLHHLVSHHTLDLIVPRLAKAPAGVGIPLRHLGRRPTRDFAPLTTHNITTYGLNN